MVQQYGLVPLRETVTPRADAQVVVPSTCNPGCRDPKMGDVNLPSLAVTVVAALSLACSNQSGPGVQNSHDAGAPVNQAVHWGEHAVKATTFAVGSSASQVSTAMGAPDEVRSKSGDMEIWSYKFSSVTFRKGKVVGWEDHSRVLRTVGSGDTRIVQKEPERGDTQTDATMVPSGVTAIRGGGGASASSTGSANPSVQFVEGHQRSDGSSVRGYYRTTGDTSRTNNFSSRGNVNPYSGKRGSR